MLKAIKYTCIQNLNESIFSLLNNAAKLKYNSNSTVCFVWIKDNYVYFKTDTLDHQVHLRMINSIRPTVGKNKLLTSNPANGIPTVILVPLPSLPAHQEGLEFISKWAGQSVNKDNNITVKYTHLWTKEKDG
jgi:hypothetical protein